MKIIPAIDLRKGRCVRLFQGDGSRETVYSEDPLSVARRWVSQGAALLHLVDLDGAFGGTPGEKNRHIIARIAREAGVSLQVGGGIRTFDRAEALFKAGIDRVILGTAAVTDPKLVLRLTQSYPGRILVAVDVRAGKVAAEGWIRETAVGPLELAARMADLGVKEIIYTDIQRDGTLTGPDLESLAALIQGVPGVGIIASGGVSSLEDVKVLSRIPGLKGVIVGQALYRGRFSLSRALEACG